MNQETLWMTGICMKTKQLFVQGMEVINYLHLFLPQCYL